MSCWWEIHPLRAAPTVRPTDGSSRWADHTGHSWGVSQSVVAGGLVEPEAHRGLPTKIQNNVFKGLMKQNVDLRN